MFPGLGPNPQVANRVSIVIDLALLAVSSLISNTFSIIQQGRVITWYVEVVTAQFKHKQAVPGNDPELAISGGSVGVDLVLYYIRKFRLSSQRAGSRGLSV